MGNKMRPLKFDNKQYYFRNIFKNIPTNRIFKVSLIKIVPIKHCPLFIGETIRSKLFSFRVVTMIQ